MSDWPQDRIDEEMLGYGEGDDYEYDDGQDCGGWFNGQFSYYDCLLAGTEFCDWECPYGASSQVWHRRGAETSRKEEG